MTMASRSAPTASRAATCPGQGRAGKMVPYGYWETFPVIAKTFVSLPLRSGAIFHGQTVAWSGQS